MSVSVRIRYSTEKYFHSCSPYEFLISTLIETNFTTCWKFGVIPWYFSAIIFLHGFRELY